MREIVKEYLIITGTKQKWICQQIGISESYLSKYLKGEKELTIIYKIKLKKLIGIN